MPLIFRKAEEKDFDIMWEMQLEMLATQRVVNHRITAESFRRDMFGDSQLAQILIAKVSIGNESFDVGYIMYFVGYSSSAGKRLHIEDIYVKEKYRKSGYGKELMNKVAQVAVDIGALTLFLECYEWNTQALEFYKSMKFNIADSLLLRLSPGALKEMASS